ncbi:MAG: PilW family protein [Arenimonas sp.]
MKHYKLSNSGYSLVELMISVTLGIMVVGATLGIFVANRHTYVAAENVGRIQENARTAYELMTRDVREAGGTPCSSHIPVANVLNSPDTNWWSNLTTPVMGYESGALGVSIAGTDAIEIKSSSASTYTVASHNPTSAVISLNTSSHDLLIDDILIVCDHRQASIFQMSGPNATNATVVHNVGAGTPGNCSKGLGFKVPIDCSTNGTAYTYGPNSLVSKLSASRWYIGSNGRPAGCVAATTCGRSLYRQVLRNTSGTNAPVAEEIAEGVRDMQILYLLPGATNYVAANAVPAARWAEVTAVRITYTLEGNDRVGTNGETIQRTLAHTVTLRNRNS